MRPSPDQLQIMQLFDDGDRALIAADATAMRRIYADDYVQHDETGKPSAREELISNLVSGKIRFASMKSISRRIRFLRDDVAIVHGEEEDEIVQEGQSSTVRYIYMDVVMKRNGSWQIVASQLAKAC